MSDSLQYEAGQAESIGNALAAFRTPNPDYVQDINAVIAESNLLGSALRDVQRLVNSGAADFDYAEDDLKLVHRCVAGTLKGVWGKIGLVGDGRLELFEWDYQRTWRDIMAYCRDTGSSVLSVRLQDYRLFIGALCKAMKRENLPHSEYAALLHRIKQFDPLTNARLRIDTEAFDDGALVQQSRSANKQQSFERVRGTPLSPAASDENRPQFPSHFFPMHSPPMSPPTTVSSLSQESSNDLPPSEHWARAVFSDLNSSTPLAQIPREDSQYHGPNHPTHGLPSSRYSKALEMEFPPKLGTVSLHYAPSRAMRAKMVVEVPMSRDQVFNICLPVDRLEVMREGCMLRFYRPDGRHWALWVSLNFSNVERLILFANTVTAMRSASGKGPSGPIRRDGRDGEYEVFKATCECRRRTRYTLSTLWDKSSNSIRLQASVKGGHLEGTPIWTAWITHYKIDSPSWCQPLGRKLILLRSLRPHVFSARDEIERAEDGSYRLNFEHSADAKDFIQVMKELGHWLKKEH